MKTVVYTVAVLALIGCGAAVSTPSAPPAPTGPAPHTGALVDGKASGEWTIRHQNGAVAGRGTYEAGRREGRWTWSFAGGQKQGEGGYRDGRRHGRWQRWAVDGSVVSDEDFKDGTRMAARVHPPRPGKSGGSCSKSDIGWRMAAAERDVRVCYEAARSKNPDVRGRVDARWVIGSDGAVFDVALKSNLENVDLLACVENVIWRTPFILPRRGRCTVGRPFLLVPQ